MKVIIFMLLLCSCAASKEPEIIPEISGEETVIRPPLIKEVVDDKDTRSDCSVEVKQEGNCTVTVVYCSGILEGLDVKCFSGRYIFPWENLPDPPPETRK